jgi:SAM-dependent methyltransferase
MDAVEKFKTQNSGSLKNGVYFLSALMESDAFENMYLKMRTQEGRVYDDQTVRNLPEIEKSHRNYKEWSIRKNSSEKLTGYLAKKKTGLNILDLGCGNGWLANKLSGISGAAVFGVDINQQELEQAARVFGNKINLAFVYADIFDSKINVMKFDVIILAGVLMYFKDLEILINKLKEMLSEGGEIHLIDNALYNKTDVEGARLRTLEHYKQMRMPEMAGHIYHHLLNEFDRYNPEIIYNPNSLASRVKRKSLETGLSPFYWMKIMK